MTTTLRRLSAGIGATAFAAALALTTSPAHAETINVDYDVNGTTVTAGTGSAITLGPAVMHSFVEEDGSFTGDMVLPGTRTSFNLAGFIPITADVNFEPTGPTTGQLTRVNRQRTLASTSTYYVRLSNLRVGFFPLFAGANCRTSDPVTVPANTPEGEFFDIATGGRLVGEYTIGEFENCGLNTGVINSVIPGDGNTIELNLTNGRIAN
ncbi:hypothetical protein EHW97_14945 [Aeromicrobium camelliae]|uniref:Uncharacterized protein n=1 Tax=Aeromicrobium camelliae TaxID=1538144 RepID=A0A3N6WJZ5_9ACTN|nr:hypothetical protein [Aeromicrobium camelliae]RQN01988.1 hypothetical protein EHW97_14945 [Aeromicrobium camelliae]